jgi:hypothetical protein
MDPLFDLANMQFKYAFILFPTRALHKLLRSRKKKKAML